MWIWLCVIAASVLVDQLTKLWTVAALEVEESVAVIPNVLHFTYIQNPGAAFGMLSEHRWIFMVVSSVAIVALLLYLWRARPESKWACTAISLIIGGGIGNMIDRIRLPYVIDMIDFCAFPTLWMWIFNVADACVCVGAGILIVWLIVSIVQESKKEKAERAAATAEDAEKAPEAAEKNGEEDV